MRYWFFLLVGIFLVLPVLAQVDSTATPDVILLTPTETPTATLTATWTATFTPELTATPQPSNTPEVTEVIQPTVEATVEITPEVTEIVEVTAEVSPEILVIAPVASPIPELTESLTLPEITVEATESVEITPELTEETVIPIATTLATATPGGTALRFVQGIVTYQNRASSARIEVVVWSEDKVLLSVATTNDNGVYSVPVPVDQSYSLAIDGELHQGVQIEVQINEVVSPIVLAGGDLDDDGCIGQSDLDMLIRNYDITQTSTTDINADGITNLSDLAILTGNYQDCALEQPIIVEIMPEATAEVLPEVTAEVTSEITVETTAEVTEVPPQP